jgi:hypothetical protein
VVAEGGKVVAVVVGGVGCFDNMGVVVEGMKVRWSNWG